MSRCPPARKAPEIASRSRVKKPASSRICTWMVVSGGQGAEPGRVRREQAVGAGDGDRGEDSQAEGAAQLLGGVEQAGRETGLVARYAGVRGGGDGNEHAAHAQRHDEHPREHVAEVGPVYRYPREVVDAGCAKERAGPTRGASRYP